MLSRLKALRWVALAAALVVWSCGSATNRDAGGIGAGGDGGAAGGRGSLGAQTACVDGPTNCCGRRAGAFRAS